MHLAVRTLRVEQVRLDEWIDDGDTECVGLGKAHDGVEVREEAGTNLEDVSKLLSSQHLRTGHSKYYQKMRALFVYTGRHTPGTP